MIQASPTGTGTVVVKQGTEEWRVARRGFVGASRVADIIAKTKSGISASRATYMGELIAERLTGVSADSYKSIAMDWGTENEAQARATYSFLYDTPVEETGFVLHPKIEWAGASPDGLVKTDGLLEIKSPNTATHIDTLLGQNITGRYLTQMQWQMACTGRAWCDFASYDPRMPETMRLHVRRVDRDDKMIGELEAAVIDFLREMDAKIATLTERFNLVLKAA